MTLRTLSANNRGFCFSSSDGMYTGSCAQWQLRVSTAEMAEVFSCHPLRPELEKKRFWRYNTKKVSSCK